MNEEEFLSLKKDYLYKSNIIFEKYINIVNEISDLKYLIDNKQQILLNLNAEIQPICSVFYNIPREFSKEMNYYSEMHILLEKIKLSFHEKEKIFIEASDANVLNNYILELDEIETTCLKLAAKHENIAEILNYKRRIGIATVDSQYDDNNYFEIIENNEGFFVEQNKTKIVSKIFPSKERAEEELAKLELVHCKYDTYERPSASICYGSGWFPSDLNC